MEKDKNKIIIITEALEKEIKNKKTSLNYNLVYSPKQNKTINTLINTKKQKKIHIYDITWKQKKRKEYSVKNHINKTGINPLIGKQKKFKIDFLDITSIYIYITKKASITTSLGEKYYSKKKTTNLPSTYLANIAIICKALNFKHIEGSLVNTFFKD